MPCLTINLIIYLLKFDIHIRINTYPPRREKKRKHQSIDKHVSTRKDKEIQWISKERDFKIFYVEVYRVELQQDSCVSLYRLSHEIDVHVHLFRNISQLFDRFEKRE